MRSTELLQKACRASPAGIICGFMSARIRYQVERLLEVFQDAWAERDACRTVGMDELAGQKEKWEVTLQASRTKAQVLFQPARSALKGDKAILHIIEELLERLENSLPSP
jgi:hypothetical protein